MTPVGTGDAFPGGPPHAGQPLPRTLRKEDRGLADTAPLPSASARVCLRSHRPPVLHQTLHWRTESHPRPQATAQNPVTHGTLLPRTLHSEDKCPPMSLHAGPVGPDDAIHGGSRLDGPARGTVAYPPSDTCPVCRHPRAAFGRDCRWSRCPWDVERRPPGGRAGRSWSSTDGTYPWCGVVGISFVFHCFGIRLEDHLPPIKVENNVGTSKPSGYRPSPGPPG